MQTIHIKSEVGSDGVLDLHIPLGSAEAKTKVMVTVESLPPLEQTPVQDWPAFVKATYGSCASLGLEEPDDLPLQQQDWLS